MKFPLFAAVTLIACVTLVANSTAGNSILRFVQHLPGKDLTGHFALYAALGISLSLYLRDALKRHSILVRFAIALIVTEEFSQMFIGHRTFSLFDLAASISGFVFGVSSIRMFSLTYQFRKWLLGLTINQAVPMLNLFRKGLPWNTDFSELQNFPAETWGRETYAFLTNRNLSFLPKYEHHDALHVLLDYDTTVVGEARLQAFMVGNQTPTFAGRGLYILASAMLPEHWKTFALDRRRGVESQAIDWLAVEHTLSTPLLIVRDAWKIQRLDNLQNPTVV